MATVKEIVDFIIYNAQYTDDNRQSITFSEIADELEITTEEITEITEKIKTELSSHSGIENISISESVVSFNLDEETESFIDEETEYTEQEKEDDELLDEVIREETQNGNQDLFELQTNPKMDEKEKAKKMTNIYLLVLKKYLQKECQKDTYFSKKYKPELLEKCWNYITKETQKSTKGNVAMIKSYTIFAQAKAYFDDEIYIKEQKEEEEKKAKAEKDKIEFQKKREQNKIEAEQKAKEKAEKEQKAKEREEEWKKFLANDNSCKLSESEIDMEKYKHLKQQNLFDF